MNKNCNCLKNDYDDDDELIYENDTNLEVNTV